jgi:hypothetical protein
VSFYFDFFDPRRVHRKLSLDTFAPDDPANDEHFARTGPTFGDHGATENLDTFFLAFLNFGVNINGIADPKFVYLFLKIGAFNGLKNLLAHDLRDQNTKGSETKRADNLTDGGRFGKPKWDDRPENGFECNQNLRRSQGELRSHPAPANRTAKPTVGTAKPTVRTAKPTVGGTDPPHGASIPQPTEAQGGWHRLATSPPIPR